MEQVERSFVGTSGRDATASSRSSSIPTGVAARDAIKMPRVSPLCLQCGVKRPCSVTQRPSAFNPSQTWPQLAYFVRWRPRP